MVVHGNQPESLRDLMLAWMARHPLAPLEDEQILVQSNGVAQWLKLSLARDPGAGGCGIAAAIHTELPSRFIWQAYRAVLGADAVPATSPFDKQPLVWRLMRLLPRLLPEAAFEPLRRFLADDPDSRKRHQLAERLADLFDQYQVYRADWLAEWAQGRDVLLTSAQGRLAVPPVQLWQPRLWRALLEDIGPERAASGRAEVHRRFLDRCAAGPGTRPAGLPRRLVVFGISSLPQQSLEALAALARWTQVLMCVHNPCEHDWSHLIADKDLLRGTRQRQRRRAGGEGDIPDEALHLHAQPLLAAWGKQGRDFIRLLDRHDEQEAYAQRFAAIGQRIDCFEPNAGDTLLRQLQDDIRDLRPLQETRERWPALPPGADASIRFHVTHGPQREVEVLHDQLLAALAADPTLQPRDVIVMLPDVAAYAPHIKAVFGLPRPGDPRHIPFAVADQPQRHQDALLAALEKLLSLPQSRLAVSDVLDLLEVGALRQRFGIDESSLPLLGRWIAAANIRWGLHAQQREGLGLPAGQAHNSWDFGLQRMLLGYACGAGEAWADVEPLDEVGGLDAVLLGPLVKLLEALEALWRTLGTPATPEAWGERIRGLLDLFFDPRTDGDQLTLLRLRAELQGWLDHCADAGLAEPVSLPVVRERLLAQLDAAGLGQPFLSGGVTFATLMPMRAIPFRCVALLGMNDGDYPRSRVPMDFDLMAQDWRAGDRSRREDDRYLFLEALLSARDRLHISWVGRSIHDDTDRPASVLVAQLRDHLAAGWRLQGDEALPRAEAGARLLRALTVEHRLQPFHPAYFSQGGDARLFSYAREWQAVAGAAPAQAPDGQGATLPPWPWEGPLTLRLLSDFLKEPARSFFQLRLGIHFDEDDPSGNDQEPFGVNALENWQLQDELIRAQKAAVLAGQPRVDALAAQLQRIARRGALPAGAFAALQQEALAAPMQDMFGHYTNALAQWPTPLPDEALDWLPPGADASLRLVDWLGDLRTGPDGTRCRLLLDSSGVIKDNRYRRDKVVPYWVAHVAAHLAGATLTTLIVSKAGNVTLQPLEAERARALWAALLDAWQQGLRRPLPLALRTGLAWLDKAGDSLLSTPDVLEAARRAYEDHDPKFGRFAEGVSSACLARAFPDFHALNADGEFERWTLALLAPMAGAIGRSPPRAGKGGAADQALDPTGEGV